MIEIGKTYQLKPGAYGSRWGDKFRVRKITDRGVVCGFWIGRRGYPQQHGCVKMEDLKKMIEE